jgi:hypothetical protein
MSYAGVVGGPADEGEYEDHQKRPQEIELLFNG